MFIYLIIVPVAGAIIGGVVGGIVGTAVGQGEGILIAELVEVIDNKSKENQRIKDLKIEYNETKKEIKNETKNETQIKEEDNESKSIKSKTVWYGNEPDTEKQIPSSDETLKPKKTSKNNSFLKNLVLKFKREPVKLDDNLERKEEESSDINQKYTSLIDENEEDLIEEGEQVLFNANEKIKLDDFDVFVLNDSNELPESLNIDNAFDSTGHLTNRNSLDSFQVDSLPDSIDVYLTIK
jgi:flagellar biosynthesis GTPase FlhF